MIVSMHQPAYLPWLGYLHRLALSDVHITLDHVQFEKNSFINRNRVRGAGVEAVWLTVPVRTTGDYRRRPLHEIEIDNTRHWRRKHWETIRQSYCRTPFFDAHARFFASIYEREWRYLVDLCQSITTYLLDAFDIGVSRRSSRTMRPRCVKSALVLELCQVCQADTYLSGVLGRDYLDETEFAEAGIDVRYQDYRHPVYTQTARPAFMSHLSAIDLLFEHGPRARNIMLSGQEVVSA